ncbi:hypothetical protein PCANC_09781 [Puccinia coronata f. sp. avenae]|uniref:Uncharacterized protein n=1 Tax=Puccinia coronata f. sp. avenae TaxID=200324 RepID=A0A2N5VT98_9BASI|nr:hypothetical protein PCANC_09781 [Puccinia coronata f. sp. avenae]
MRRWHLCTVHSGGLIAARPSGVRTPIRTPRKNGVQPLHAALERRAGAARLSPHAAHHVHAYNRRAGFARLSAHVSLSIREAYVSRGTLIRVPGTLIRVPLGTLIRVPRYPYKGTTWYPYKGTEWYPYKGTLGTLIRVPGTLITVPNGTLIRVPGYPYKGYLGTLIRVLFGTLIRVPRYPYSVVCSESSSAIKFGGSHNEVMVKFKSST